MNILLVGGNRFVGVEIAWHLLRAGHNLTVMALDAPPADMRPHIRWLLADRNDETGLTDLMRGEQFDAVVDNIAFEPHHVEILSRVLKGKTGRYFLTSTTDIYPGNFPRTYSEDQVDIREYDMNGLTGAPRYMYGKRSCEAVLMKSGIPWTVVRPCIVTGPRDNRSGAPAARPIHWFEDAARSHFWPCRVLDGGPVLLCREDEGVLQLVWVGDLARAVTRLIADEQAAGQAYNLTGSEIWTNERLVRALAAAAGRVPEIVQASRQIIGQAGIDYSPVYGASAYWSLADNAKLRATGWSPTPAEQWLPYLLEELPPPISRPWYHTRMQEIALAKHLQRHQSSRPVISPNRRPIEPRTAAITFPPSVPLSGGISPSLSSEWKKKVCEQVAAVRPAETGFKTFCASSISGIGIGTWMGALTREVDDQYVAAMVHAGVRGINVFDTAINYRNMKAERCVGAALRQLNAAGVPRGAFLVSTKGGYVTNDAEDPRSADQYLRQEYLEKGLLDETELERRHALTGRFISRQLEQSLNNLGLSTVDIYYLHNPEETACFLEPEQFKECLTEVFAVLEMAVAAGKIGCYGLATWEGLRLPPTDRKHLSLEMALSAARDAAGGEKHHLAAIQLPFNVSMDEAFTLPTQVVAGRLLPALQAAKELGLYSFSSASLFQGRALESVFGEKLHPLRRGLSLPTAALNVIRSNGTVGTALVGMRQIAHVEDALSVAGREPLHDDAWSWHDR